MEILSRFEDIVKNLKHPPVIVEIGINDGTHTNLMNQILRKYHREYKYFAFEPDPRLRKAIDAIVALHPNVIFSDEAVGPVEGEVTFHLSGGEEKRPGVYKQAFTGSSSLLKPKDCLKYWPDMTFEETKCKCTTLNKIMWRHNLEYIDFIWMDTQGAEGDIIKGALSNLYRIKHIFTEVGTGSVYEGEASQDELLNLLHSSELVEKYESDIFLTNRG